MISAFYELVTEEEGNVRLFTYRKKAVYGSVTA